MMKRNHGSWTPTVDQRNSRKCYVKTVVSFAASLVLSFMRNTVHSHTHWQTNYKKFSLRVGFICLWYKWLQYYMLTTCTLTTCETSLITTWNSNLPYIEMSAAFAGRDWLFRNLLIPLWSWSLLGHVALWCDFVRDRQLTGLRLPT